MAISATEEPARRGARRRRRPMAEINVTPFVDVMLVLLIVFMVTAPLLTVGVTVDLPETASSPLPGQDEPLTVSVARDGTVFLQDSQIDLADLGPRLLAITERRAGRADLRARRQGDRLRPGDGGGRRDPQRRLHQGRPGHRVRAPRMSRAAGSAAVMGQAWLLSAVLHGALAALLYFGLPFLGRPPVAIDRPITVELVSEIEPSESEPPPPGTGRHRTGAGAQCREPRSGAAATRARARARGRAAGARARARAGSGAGARDRGPAGAGAGTRPAARAGAAAGTGARARA